MPVNMFIGIVSIVHLNFQKVLMELPTVSKEAKISYDQKERLLMD